MKTKNKVSIILLSLFCAVQTVRPVSYGPLLGLGLPAINSPVDLTYDQRGSIYGLLIAIRVNSSQAVTLALQQGDISTDITLADNQTPIISWAAVESGQNNEIIPQLIEHGFNVNAANTSGFTALHNATKNIAIAETLIQHGALVNAQAVNGSTPLHEAAVHAKELEMVQFLLDNGANPAIQNNDGKTPLAVAQGSLQLFQNLYNSAPNEERQAHYQAIIQKLEPIIQILEQAQQQQQELEFEEEVELN